MKAMIVQVRFIASFVSGAGARDGGLPPSRAR